MRCPKCNKEMLCGCGSCVCRKRNQGKVVTYFSPDGNTQFCGHCHAGFDADALLDVEAKQILADTGTTTLTEAMEVIRARAVI